MNKHAEELIYRLEGDYAALKEQACCDPREHEVKQALRVANTLFARGLETCRFWRNGR